MRVARHCTADDVVTELTGLVATRGAPEQLRMDNGPEMIAWALRDYCRLAGARTQFIEPGSPWQNPFIESFNGRVRDELLNVEEFATLTVAQVVVDAWRTEYSATGPTPPWAGAPPPSTRPAGPAHPHQRSRSGWTTQWGPVSAARKRLMTCASGHTGSMKPSFGEATAQSAQRWVRWFAATSLGAWLFARVLHRVDRVAFRLTPIFAQGC